MRKEISRRIEKKRNKRENFLTLIASLLSLAWKVSILYTTCCMYIKYSQYIYISLSLLYAAIEMCTYTHQKPPAVKPFDS
jgi:hypothetical protein